jgi:hypothetical protein
MDNLQISNNEVLVTITDESKSLLKDFGFLKEYDNCKIGRTLKNPLFYHRLQPRLSLYVLIINTSKNMHY